MHIQKVAGVRLEVFDCHVDDHAEFLVHGSTTPRTKRPFGTVCQNHVDVDTLALQIVTERAGWIVIDSRDLPPGSSAVARVALELYEEPSDPSSIDVETDTDRSTTLRR